MSYLVLARKWRPRTFDDIVSQEYVTLSLKNAVSTGKIAHAFIFSGPRGVGKTSTARILAKALNCSIGPTPEPCSECTFCKDIAEGKSLDVLEIDAASHTGVNDVREIIENIKYLPTSGKYKIYIIDEAHMLSQSAFNALLKTLEEPPPHVLFILATTEAHKIPVTILSRCQKYDFRKVPSEKIKENLSNITSKEGIKVAEETLYTVAQEADGSMRDALSLMDQLLATFGNDIAHDDALSILGVLDRSLLKSAVAGIMEKDPKACIEALNRAVEKGINPKRFAEDLLRTLRYALLLKTCGKDAVHELSDEDKNEIEGITSGESVETLESLFNLMLDGAEYIHRSFYPQIALEFTLIKLATLERTVPLDSILKRLESLSGTLKSGEPRSRFDEPRGNYGNRPSAKEKTNKSSDNLKENIKPGGEPGPEAQERSSVIKYIKSRNVPMATRLEQARSISVEGSAFKITFGNPIHTSHFRKKETETELKKFLKDFFNREMDVEISEETSQGSGGASDVRSERNESKKKIQNDPALKDAIEIFGGRVVSVKPRQKE